ncbi:MAG: hypothetical protein NC336_10165 [Clostridium sp.]|nr:hypothetical protein [Clostridium sp.]
MKATIKAFILLLAATSAACSGGGAASMRVPEITPDSAAAQTAAAIVAQMAPADGAAHYLGWLASAPVTDGDYARTLAREIMRQYGPGDSLRFAGAVDSIHRLAPPEVQAHRLAVGSTPEALAHVLSSADSASAVLVPLIAREYEADAELHRRFAEAVGRWRRRN